MPAYNLPIYPRLAPFPSALPSTPQTSPNLSESLSAVDDGRFPGTLAKPSRNSRRTRVVSNETPPRTWPEPEARGIVRPTPAPSRPSRDGAPSHRPALAVIQPPTLSSPLSFPIDTGHLDLPKDRHSHFRSRSDPASAWIRGRDKALPKTPDPGRGDAEPMPPTHQMTRNRHARSSSLPMDPLLVGPPESLAKLPPPRILRPAPPIPTSPSGEPNADPATSMPPVPRRASAASAASHPRPIPTTPPLRRKFLSKRYTRPASLSYLSSKSPLQSHALPSFAMSHPGSSSTFGRGSLSGTSDGTRGSGGDPRRGGEGDEALARRSEMSLFEELLVDSLWRRFRPKVRVSVGIAGGDSPSSDSTLRRGREGGKGRADEAAGAAKARARDVGIMTGLKPGRELLIWSAMVRYRMNEVEEERGGRPRARDPVGRVESPSEMVRRERERTSGAVRARSGVEYPPGFKPRVDAPSSRDATNEGGVECPDETAEDDDEDDERPLDQLRAIVGARRLTLSRRTLSDSAFDLASAAAASSASVRKGSSWRLGRSKSDSASPPLAKEIVDRELSDDPDRLDGLGLDGSVTFDVQVRVRLPASPQPAFLRPLPSEAPLSSTIAAPSRIDDLLPPDSRSSRKASKRSKPSRPASMSRANLASSLTMMPARASPVLPSSASVFADLSMSEPSAASAFRNPGSAPPSVVPVSLLPALPARVASSPVSTTVPPLSIDPSCLLSPRPSTSRSIASARSIFPLSWSLSRSLSASAVDRSKREVAGGPHVAAEVAKVGLKRSRSESWNSLY
ncbi:hypothetical protein JCM10212_002801 [Sporobolomyces blumeae]